MAVVKLPAIVTRFDDLLNVKPADAFALPESLNSTCVLLPPTAIFPEMLPDTLPINDVAVIDPFAKLALIDVLITADEFPLALEVVNVGYAVVALDVFCNNADAFVALVALGTVPLTFAPATELAVVANDTAPETFAPATEFAS